MADRHNRHNDRGNDKQEDSKTYRNGIARHMETLHFVPMIL